MKGIRSYIGCYLFIAPAIVIFALFILYPALYTVLLSFNKWNGYTTSWQGFVGVTNFRTMFHDDVFWISFGDSLKILVTRLPAELVLGTIFAFLLDRSFAGKETIKGILFLPVVAPVVVVGIVMQRILDPYTGLLSIALTGVGLKQWVFPFLADPGSVIYTVSAISVWKNVGFTMVIVIAGLQNIPQELKDAAVIDGASEAQYSIRIALPLASGAIGIAAVIASISVFKIFDLVYVLTGGGPAHASEVLASYMYLEAFRFNTMGVAAASSLLILAIALLLTLMSSKLLPNRDLA